MRWKIDENIHPAVAALLQGRGHDAVTVWDQNLQGASDRRLADICLYERRALLTLDLDFANILAYPPEAHAGIVVLRLVHQSQAWLLRVMEQAIAVLETERVEGRLWVIDESKLRVRGRS